MSDLLTPLILDMLEWIAVKPRPYAEVMDAWRTSCPKLTVWEDAVDGRFIGQEHGADGVLMVHLAPAGQQFLEAGGRRVRIQS